MLRYLCLFVLLFIPPVLGIDSSSVLVLAPGVQLRGADISHHQKRIEWDTVATHKELDFVFVKATEGGDYTDSLYCYNWEEIHRVGIMRGAYHFFRPFSCGVDQAAHFLSVTDMQPGDLPPVLDVETLDAATPDDLRQEVRNWLVTVEQQLGVRPILYSNQHFFERYLAADFAHYPLWIARYADEEPVLSNGNSWHFWQHTNEGCIEGISQKVDLNFYRGTPEMMRNICWNPEPTALMTP